MDFHLPRVQTSDDQIRPNSKSVPEQKESSSSAFPLVQIAEKYRREYKGLKGDPLPIMEGRNDHKGRPKTAPLSALPKNNDTESRARDEVQIVKEPSCVTEASHEDDSKSDHGNEFYRKQGITVSVVVYCR